MASDRIYSGYFKDYFNFVDEIEYRKLKSDRLIGDNLNDVKLLGKYKIKVLRGNGVNYINLNIKGTIELNRKGIVIETNLPTLTKFTGTYDSELNSNIEYVRKGVIVGRIDYKEKAIFSLILDLEKKIVVLNSLEIGLDSEGLELNKRETTTFKIED